MNATSADNLTLALTELTELRETVRKTLRGGSRDRAYEIIDRSETIIARIHDARRLDQALVEAKAGRITREEFLAIAAELAG